MNYTLRNFLWGAVGFVIFLLLSVLIAGKDWTIPPPVPGYNSSTVLLANDGKTTLLSPWRSEHEELDKLSDFSPYIVKAVIAQEDHRYDWHLGVDPIGIIRALFSTQQGGSTIIQQLARSVYPDIGKEKTLGRKIQEVLAALKLEFVYSKNEILRLYLNRVFLGGRGGINIYGFEDAAQYYFDKSASFLNLAEAATIAATIPAPNARNPEKEPDNVEDLRDIMIDSMLNAGVISEDEAHEAKRTHIKFNNPPDDSIARPFRKYVAIDEIKDPNVLGKVGEKNDWVIYTTLDPKIQELAERALRKAIQNNGDRLGISEGAIVTLDSRTGEILAMVGGETNEGVNLATSTNHSPASTFKVFTYAAALEKGISPRKLYSCDGLSWQGQSYEPCERSSGSIDFYRAMAQSENPVALRVAKEVGLEKVADMAKKLGINSELKLTPGLVLGQEEVSLLEMTGAYTAFANGGVWHRPHGIKRIKDRTRCGDPDDFSTCKESYSFDKDQKDGTKRVLSSKTAATMNNLLRGVVRSGTGRRADMGYKAAGKTGTSDKGTNLWFIGYLPDYNLVTGIWLGNEPPGPTKGSSGNAAALWKAYMSDVVKLR